MIHHGRILFDGALAALADRFAATKTIGVTLRRRRSADLSTLRRGHAAARTAASTLRVTPRRRARGRPTRLLRDLHVADLTIEDPPIEDVIEQVFAERRGRSDERRDARRPRRGRRRCAAGDAVTAAGAARPSAASGRLVDLYATHDADRDRGAVPVPGRELLLHDRHGRRAGRLPRRVDRRSRTSRAARSAGSRRASSRRTTSSGRWSGT